MKAPTIQHQSKW